jgi:hypothetical protein
MIKCFLSLLLLMWFITFIDFRMLNHPCIPAMKPTWSWWIIFLMCCWIRKTQFLLAFVSCTRGFTVTFVYMLHNVPCLGSPPPSFSPIRPPPKWFQVHCCIFTQAYEVRWLYSPRFALCIHLPLPLIRTLNITCFTFLSFIFKGTFFVQRSFIMWIYWQDLAM